MLKGGGRLDDKEKCANVLIPQGAGQVVQMCK